MNVRANGHLLGQPNTIPFALEDADTGYSEVALGFDDEHKILPWFENSECSSDRPFPRPFLLLTLRVLPRAVWFSNRDMLQAVERCVDYEPDEYLVVFGMSNNKVAMGRRVI